MELGKKTLPHIPFKGSSTKMIFLFHWSDICPFPEGYEKSRSIIGSERFGATPTVDGRSPAPPGIYKTF